MSLYFVSTIIVSVIRIFSAPTSSISPIVIDRHHALHLERVQELPVPLLPVSGCITRARRCSSGSLPISGARSDIVHAQLDRVHHVADREQLLHGADRARTPRCRRFRRSPFQRFPPRETAAQRSAGRRASSRPCGLITVTTLLSIIPVPPRGRAPRMMPGSPLSSSSKPDERARFQMPQRVAGRKFAPYVDALESRRRLPLTGPVRKTWS